MGPRYALVGSWPLGLNSISRIWMHWDRTSFLQSTADPTITYPIAQTCLVPAWAQRHLSYGTPPLVNADIISLSWRMISEAERVHLSVHLNSGRAKTRTQTPWRLEQCHFCHTVWWMKLKFISWSQCPPKRKYIALKINTWSKFTTFISNDISGRRQKKKTTHTRTYTHNTVSKLNRAASHYFLKIF